MTNFRYRVDNEDIIVSPEENEIIKSRIKAGASMVYLRGNTLAINVNFIRYIQETDQATAEEEAKRESILKLEGEKWQPPTPQDIARRKKMVEDWKRGKIVKEMPK